MGNAFIYIYCDINIMGEFFMNLLEWGLVIAAIDGPIIGLLYVIWKRLKNESK